MKRRFFQTLHRLLLLTLLAHVIGGHTLLAANPLLPTRQAEKPNLIANKWINAPQLDGTCNDEAYREAEPLILRAEPLRQVYLVHSGLHVYACFEVLPQVSESMVLLQVDSNHNQSEIAEAGDYRFILTMEGKALMFEGDGNGDFVELSESIFADSFRAVAANVSPEEGKEGWRAELQISLEWFGGYARIDGLAMGIEAGDERIDWPSEMKREAPLTWGSLTLAPLYPDGVEAGSVFVDGQTGYLVVPYSPTLNPPEVTLEAWVKTVDGDCGSLIGNDFRSSYWLALCQSLQFSHAGEITLANGQRSIDDGWHHVALTVDDLGRRNLYVDGTLDTQTGWQPAQEVDADEPQLGLKLGESHFPLRIGSDRHSPEGLELLHAYLHDLRIWNRVLSQEEVNKFAFEPPAASDRNLMAWWPFANSLRDQTGRHQAGLVGTSALARTQRDQTAFPAPHDPEPYAYPTADPLDAWDAHIPTLSSEIDAQMKVDGVCRLSEYENAALLLLEPDRNKAFSVQLGNQALYLCSNILFGRNTAEDFVTLFFDRNGDGNPGDNNALPQEDDLRITLSPNGNIDFAQGDGSSFVPLTTVIPEGSENKVISDTVYAIQEDIYRVNAPWWSVEVRLPYSLLAPYTPDGPLHFAVEYHGTVPATAPSDKPWDKFLSGRWPLAFVAENPSTWGVANDLLSTGGDQKLFLPMVRRSGTNQSSEQASSNAQASNDLQASSDAQTTTTAQPTNSRSETPVDLASLASVMAATVESHQAPPTVANFNNRCPDINSPLFPFERLAKWPTVDPVGHPVVRGEGTLNEIYVSREDSPWIHNSHDIDMRMTPFADSRWLMLSGHTSLVLETESAGFPIHARPLPGSHVTVVGRWIFDCGHEAKTEIHPTPIFESDFLEVRPVIAGKPMQQVRMIRLWMNSHPGAFAYTLSPFTFRAELPPAAGEHPFLSVLQGDAGRVRAQVVGNQVEVTVTPNATGSYLWEMMVGYVDSLRPYTGYDTYTFQLDQIDIFDDHDHGFPDCGGLLDPGDCGEWSMTVSANKHGRQIFWNTTVDEDDSAQTINQAMVTTGGNLLLTLEGYDDDDPVAGDFIWSGTKDLGPLSSLCCNVNRTLQPGGDYKLFYRVLRGGTMALGLPDTAFWSPRQQNEPNDSTYSATNLGSLSVPNTLIGVNTSSYNGFISERNHTQGNTRLLGRDPDLYQFELSDFADVQLQGIPGNLSATIQNRDPWYWDLPAHIQQIVGYRGATVRIASNTGQVGDQPYTLTIRRNLRSLPADWGETQDGHGRLVDLARPEEGVKLYPPTLFQGEKRNVQKDWAWQELLSDVDLYDLRIPPLTPRRDDQPPCEEYDQPGSLRIEAQNMQLITVVAIANNQIELTDLARQVPNQNLLVRIQNRPGQGRGLYRFAAEWQDNKYYTESECRLRRAVDAALKYMAGVRFRRKLEHFWQPGKGPDLPYPSPLRQEFVLTALGSYLPFQFDYGSEFNAVIAAPLDQPMHALLFDSTGVLLAESTALVGEEATKFSAPDGLAPQALLRFTRMKEGERYLVQYLPAGASQPDQQQTFQAGLQVIAE